MKRFIAYLLLLLPLLTGCAKDSKSGLSEIKARSESMPAQDDGPMEGMPDDGQGIIYF